MNIEIDFFAHQSKLKLQRNEKTGKQQVFDPVRKKFVAWQPEESVRQLFLQYLLYEKNCNPNKVRVEKQLIVNGLQKRCDILIYDQSFRPAWLVECKAPNIDINQDVFEQIARYNLPLQVQFLIVTNGLKNYICEMDYDKKTFIFLDKIPNF